ncbi:MAG: DEAD/DEAH box helicase [Terrimicrobiaceae bacterium]|nr:DEAD/DEAH box helicase [Terrimicrobiaceae bacterium]
MSLFSKLDVPEDLVRGLDALGISTPTSIQASAIPFLIRDGGDLVAQAQTGTGKTAAFGLPLLTKIDPANPKLQALVLSPTRELAKQIGKALFQYTKFSQSKIFVEVTGGGDKIGEQVARLKRPTHIVVATPGRLFDLLELGALQLDSVRHLVLDEADEMLSMGFRKEVVRIVERTTSRRSTWLFSATFPEKIQRLIADSMSADPKVIKVEKADVVNRNISHRYVICGREDKDDWLANFLQTQETERGMIFCRTRAGAIKLGSELEKRGVATGVLQGDLSQKDRDKVMRAFKKERTRFLVATDVAARGIDVEGLSFVIHRQLPEKRQYYTHRAGRTARAGKKGVSICLIEPNEKRDITELERELGLAFKPLDSE